MKHPWLGELGSRSILILCPTLSFFPRKRNSILRENLLKLAVNQGAPQFVCNELLLCT